MWTLNPTEWKEVDFWLANRKFKQRALTKNDTDLVPTYSGVYLMCGRPLLSNMSAPELRNILYIGKSENLRQRFQQHCGQGSAPHIRELVKLYGSRLEFWFTEVPVERITEVENALIKCFKPQANTQGIPGRLKPPVNL